MKSIRNNLTHSFIAAVCLLTAGGAMVLLLTLVAFLVRESWPVWSALGPAALLFGADWHPVSDPPQLGLATMIVSTLWVALGALLLAAPVGFCAAVFLAEFSPAWLAGIIRPVLNILTGIPSVVYGFLGATVLVRFFEVSFDMASGESLFCASVVLTVMVLPYIISTSEASLRAVPREYRDTALALGVSRQYIALRILAPLARRGLIGALVLAFGRAAGETMAVLMVAGNILVMPTSWFHKGEPLPALIALELGSAEVGSAHYQALYAAGLVLLVFLILINLVFNALRRDTGNGVGSP